MADQVLPCEHKTLSEFSSENLRTLRQGYSPFAILALPSQSVSLRPGRDPISENKVDTTRKTMFEVDFRLPHDWACVYTCIFMNTGSYTYTDTQQKFKYILFCLLHSNI